MLEYDDNDDNNDNRYKDKDNKVIVDDDVDDVDNGTWEKPIRREHIT